MSGTCLHEDAVLACPFCRGPVDSDTRVCARCQKMVAPLTVCLYCDVEFPEPDMAPAPVGRGPHAHVLVESDLRDAFTGDWFEHCTVEGCFAERTIEEVAS